MELPNFGRIFYLAQYQVGLNSVVSYTVSPHFNQLKYKVSSMQLGIIKWEEEVAHDCLLCTFPPIPSTKMNSFAQNVTIARIRN